MIDGDASYTDKGPRISLECRPPTKSHTKSGAESRMMGHIIRLFLFCRTYSASNPCASDQPASNSFVGTVCSTGCAAARPHGRQTRTGWTVIQHDTESSRVLFCTVPDRQATRNYSDRGSHGRNMKPIPIKLPTNDLCDPSAPGRVSDSTDHIVVGAPHRSANHSIDSADLEASYVTGTDRNSTFRRRLHQRLE